MSFKNKRNRLERSLRGFAMHPQEAESRSHHPGNELSMLSRAPETLVIQGQGQRQEWGLSAGMFMERLFQRNKLRVTEEDTWHSPHF